MRRAGRSRARPGYHDPTAGMAGAAPTVSALTLRLVLACFGLLVCAVSAAALFEGGHLWVGSAMSTLALAAAVDIGVISRRKRRGEPG